MSSHRVKAHSLISQGISANHLPTHLANQVILVVSGTTSTHHLKSQAINSSHSLRALCANHSVGLGVHSLACIISVLALSWSIHLLIRVLNIFISFAVGAIVIY